MDISIQFTMKEINRYEIIQNLIQRKITEEEAKKIMRLKSARQVRRIKKRVLKEGAKGVIHRNRGRPGNRKFEQKFIDKILKIVRKKYFDFKPTFAAEKLWENHNLKINKESLRQLMIIADLWKPKPRREAKNRHVWRPRKENFGEMQQFDGSYHHWFENRGEESCLLLAIDDATGRITHAKFDHNEGTKAVFHFWLEYFNKNGIPISIYLDRFSSYKINHKSAEDNKDLITQFQRAAKEIGMNLITAYSPEAKGRVERVFETLQDRLVKELRLKNISTIEEANKFLNKEFIDKFNAKFAVIPALKSNLHQSVKSLKEEKLLQIFSIQNKRRVNNDYTILFKNQFFQLKEEQPTGVFKKDWVQVEEHLDKSIKIDLKGKYLNYEILPERPKKINIPLAALTKNKSTWIPPNDHPWRRPWQVKKGVLTTTT